MNKTTTFQILAALFSALLLALIWEPFRQSQAAFIALVPLLLLIRVVSVRRAFWLGSLTGLVSWTIQLSWMLKLTDNDGPWWLVVPALLGLSAVLAIFIGLFAALAAALRRIVAERTSGNLTAFLRVGLVFLAEPILWAGTECLRSHIFTGFAWNPLGLVCTDYLTIAQLAAVGGVTLVSALVVALNGAIATFIERFWLTLKRRTPTGIAPKIALALESILPLAALAITFSWGANRIRDYILTIDKCSEYNKAHVVVEHTDNPCIFAGQPSANPWELEEQRAAILQNIFPRPDLWIWPESSVNGTFRKDPSAMNMPSQWVELKLIELSQRVAIPMLHGGVYYDGEMPMNAALLFTPFGLDREQVYAKRHLVPFGEYIPLDTTFPVLQKFAPTGLSFAPGEKVTTIKLPSGLVIGPLICFEDTVAEMARQSVLDGARLLVNMSNDAWYTPSFEAEQHARQAVMRCIETGTPMVRSSNGGKNVYISAIGEVDVDLRAREQAKFEAYNRGEKTVSALATIQPMTFNADRFPTYVVPLTDRPFASYYLQYGELTFGAPCTLIMLCLLAMLLLRPIVRRIRPTATAILLLFVSIAMPLSAEESLIPMADMAMDDGNISLAERTARTVLASLNISPEERAKAKEILIRAELAKENWQAALEQIEDCPELPASHRLVLRLAAHNGMKNYKQTQQEYAAAKLPTDDEWGVAALRLVLQADLALGTTLHAEQHFAAIEKAKGATEHIRAENALAWSARFLNAQSRAALLASAKKAAAGDPFLACALALPTAFAEASNRNDALTLLDSLLQDKTLSKTVEAKLALAAAYLAPDAPQQITYARRAIAVSREEALRREALAHLGELLCKDPATAFEGIASFEEAVRLNPSSTEAPVLQLRIAEMLQSLEKYDDALKAYNRYLSSYDIPEYRVRVRQGKARTLMAAERYDEALATFIEASEWTNSVGDLHYELLLESAEAATKAGRYTQAIALYRDLLKARPTPATQLRLAFTLEASRELTDAQAAYRAVRDNPEATPQDTFTAVMRLGALHVANDRNTEAIAEYTRALAKASEAEHREALRFARGRAYYAIGDLARAKEDFAAVCDAVDETRAADARFFMVLSLYGLGEDERARTFAQAYVDSYPNSPRLPDIFLWLAKSDFNNGDYAAACTGFESFTYRWTQEPRVPQALFLAARAAYQGQDYAKVLELVGRLAKEFPHASQLSHARFLQAEALMEHARHAEARELLTALVRHHPQAEWVGEAYGRLGDCLVTTSPDDPERLPLAIEAYRECVTRLENDPDATLMYLYKIGRVFEKQDLLNDAADQYTKLIYRVLNRPEHYSATGLRWLEKAITQLRAIEYTRGNAEAYKTLLRRIRNAHIPGLRTP